MNVRSALTYRKFHNLGVRVKTLPPAKVSVRLGAPVQSGCQTPANGCPLSSATMYAVLGIPVLVTDNQDPNAAIPRSIDH